MSITKPELVKYGPNLEKEHHLFLTVVFSFSGMIYLICIFYHLWYCHFTPIAFLPELIFGIVVCRVIIVL